MDINATLLGHVIWFAVFIWITMKYIWPPLQNAMEERRKEIAEGLAAAEQGRKDLEDAEKKSEAVIAEARANAADIIGQAEKRGSEVVEEAKNTANSEAERLIENRLSNQLTSKRLVSGKGSHLGLAVIELNQCKVFQP